MKLNKHIERLLAILGSFSDRLITIILPLRFPLVYRWTDIDEFKRLMSWMWDKNIDNLLRCIDIYVWITLEKELKNRMAWSKEDLSVEEKLNWVGDFKETISNYVQVRSIQR